MNKRIFLGGTCNGSNWRDAAKPLLDRRGLTYFDPVVKVWDDNAYENELYERATCDYVIYCITPKMTGVYSIAEVIDDSNKRPEKTIFVVQEIDEEDTFTLAQLKSLQAVGTMVERNGGNSYTSLTEAIISL